MKRLNLRRKISMLLRSPVRLKFIIWIHNYITNISLRKLIDFLFIPVGIVNYVYCVFKCIYRQTTSTKSFQYQLSIVCIVKNEAPYLEEWVRYHLSIGVEHFYIYNNDSSDDIEQVLKKFGSKVTLLDIHGPVRQLDAYNDAINRFSEQTKYLAVIDADEFIYSPKGDHKVLSIIDGVFDDRKVGGLTVNWVIYGSSNFKKKPSGLVTDRFVYRANDDFYKNRFIKTICDPRKVYSFTISHAANYLPGYHAVNELGKIVRWASTKSVHISQIRLNHYYSKSKEEFMQKRARGSGEVLGLRSVEEFEEHDKNDVLDTSMRDYNKKENLN